MYQRPNQGAKWSYNPEELPHEFESGYSHLFGREKTQYYLYVVGAWRSNKTVLIMNRSNLRPACHLLISLFMT
ncbi:Uncharacterized protein HZ326_27428 [Fusarium oxysporum f. sp. albedinis]|nr:Uncharacterized protein HZ326_27428 [Fusarium oxysporum f. sp. albedinis]